MVACPSPLPSSMIGEIDLLVSQIPASVFLSEQESRPSLVSHNSRPRWFVRLGLESFSLKKKTLAGIWLVRLGLESCSLDKKH